jgi:hypothetical protein
MASPPSAILALVPPASSPATVEVVVAVDVVAPAAADTGAPAEAAPEAPAGTILPT